MAGTRSRIGHGHRLLSRASAWLLAGALLGAGMLGPSAPAARGQWGMMPGFAPGFGGPWGGMGVGPGFGGPWGGMGVGPGWGAGFGYGYGWGGWGGWGVAPTAFGYGYGMYPGAFSVLNQPDVQAGLAYNTLATGRMSPYMFNANPWGMAPGFGFGPGLGGSYLPGFGPFGYAGVAFSNPYFSSGLTPLAVQAAADEMILSRAAPAAAAPVASPLPTRIRIITDPDQGQPRPID